MADWFDQNAPASSPAAADWFAANAPKPPPPPARTFGDAAADFLGAAWSKIDPVAAVKGAASAVANPPEALKNIGAAQGALAQKALESFKAGNYTEGIRQSLNYLIPILGPELEQAGEKMASGKVAEGLGETAGIAAGIVGPKALPPAGRALKRGGEAVLKEAAKTAPRTAERLGAMAGTAIGASVAGAPGAVVGGQMGASTARLAVQKLKGKARPPAPAAKEAVEAPMLSPQWKPGYERPIRPMAPEAEAPRAPVNPPAAPPQPTPQPSVPSSPPAQPAGRFTPTTQDWKLFEAKAPKADTKPVNFEALKRTEKATKLAQALFDSEIPSGTALKMNPEQWKMAAQGAKVAKEPSPSTVRETIQILKQLEVQAGKQNLPPGGQFSFATSRK